MQRDLVGERLRRGEAPAQPDRVLGEARR